MSNIKLYKVGGCIRDEIMGVKYNDIDYAVEANSFDELLQWLKRKKYTIFLQKPEYFSVRAKCPKTGEVIDFTLCRTDGYYSDNRHPDKVAMADIYSDLARRDFTINAMARGADGKLIDPYNGCLAIRQKTIKCVGSARDRIHEDPLRAIRAIRFAVTKEFYMNCELLDVVQHKSLAKLLKTISSERIMTELNKAFAYDTHRTLILLNCLHDDTIKVIFKNNIHLQVSNKQIKKQNKQKRKIIIERPPKTCVHKMPIPKTLHYAAQFGLYKLLIKSLDCNVCKKTLNNKSFNARLTPLAIAAQHNNVTMVTTLLQHGANINATCVQNKSVLHYAIKHNSLNTIKVLVEHKSIKLPQLDVIKQWTKNNNILKLFTSYTSS